MPAKAAHISRAATNLAPYKGAPVEGAAPNQNRVRVVNRQADLVFATYQRNINELQVVVNNSQVLLSLIFNNEDRALLDQALQAIYNV